MDLLDEIAHKSLGQIIFQKLKSRDPKDVINIDVVTKETLTVQTLLEESVKAAFLFKQLGIVKGDVVALICESTLKHIVPVLAGLYTGVVVNLLSPAYLEGEMKHSLLLSRPKCVLVSKQGLEVVYKIRKELTFVEKMLVMGTEECNVTESFDTLLQSVQDDVNDFHPIDVNVTEDIAFIVLSSGTTGLPKGVMLTHANFRIPLTNMSNPEFGNLLGETTIVIAPFCHLFGLLLQLHGLLFSMKLVIMTKFQPHLFLKAIEEYKMTKLFLIPVLLQFLIKNPMVDNYDLSSATNVLTGAAPLRKSAQETASKMLGVKIHQTYGLTETCGPCTFQVDVTKSGSCGKFPNEIQTKICNTEGKVLQPMEIGEICLKGPCVMKGYLPHQIFLDEEGFFHSGDVGYLDHDGYLYIVDRVKDIIKYKGFQISPLELDTLILTHPEVEDCGVVGIPDQRAGEVPLAFVVLKHDSQLKENDIIDFVAERISIQKRLYGGVIFVKEIPRTASGKILRRVLMENFKNGSRDANLISMWNK